ncbi:MAG: hypothetical protein IPP40_16035 [bacterium]|nr:hypothetical protein [bacterium]
MSFYNDGAFPRHPQCDTPDLDPALRDPLNLTTQEMQDIIAFMKSLTDPGTAPFPPVFRVDWFPCSG